MTNIDNDENLVFRGSGNVFDDLGLPNPEERQRKASLAYELNKIIEKEGLTQTKVAKILGITQSEVSDISRGRLKRFSVEKLIRLLELMGCQVSINVIDLRAHRGSNTEKAPKKRRAQTKRNKPEEQQEQIAL